MAKTDKEILGLSRDEIDRIYAHPEFDPLLKLMERENNAFKSLPVDQKKLALALVLSGNLDSIEGLWKLFFKRKIPNIKEFLTYDYIGSSANFYKDSSFGWTKDLYNIFSENSVVYEWILSGSIGSYKCLGKGTKVIMFDGSFKNVEEVRNGDYLLGTGGTKRLVSNCVTGIDNLYKVTQVKGISYIVNENHILSLKSSGPLAENKFGKVLNISVNEYLKLPKSSKKFELKGYCLGAEFTTSKPVWEPHFIGWWLADGASATSILSINKKDIELYKELLIISNKYNYILNISPTHNRENCQMLYIANGFRGKLVELNLLNNKHIPMEYKTSSREDRLQLLAGLLDGDGNYHKGVYTISSKWEHLASDIAFLARSLGYRVKVVKEWIKCQNFDGAYYYRLSISGNTLDEIPCRLTRKRSEKRKQIKDVTKTGVIVEPIGKGEFFGFELDGDHLFYLEDFTITHNSTNAVLGQFYTLYKVTSLRYPQLAMGSGEVKPLALILLSVSRLKADELFRMFRSFLKACKYFVEVDNEHDFLPYTSNDYSDIVPYYEHKVEGVQRLTFPNEIYVTPGSKLSHTIGSDIFGVILDEAEFRDTSSSTKTFELYSEILSRVISRFLQTKYKLVCLVSSVKHDTGIIATHIKNLDKKSPFHHLSSYSIWEVKPDLKNAFTDYGHFWVMRGTKSHPSRILDYSEIKLADEGKFKAPERCKLVKAPAEPNILARFKTNVERALMEQAGESTSGLERPFDDLSSLENIFLPAEIRFEASLYGKETLWQQLPVEEMFVMTPNGLRLKRYPNAKRYVHVDLGATGEAGICMLHKEFRMSEILESQVVYVVDFVGKITSPDRISFNKIENFLLELRKYGNIFIDSLTTDQFQSESLRQKMTTEKLATNVFRIALGTKPQPYIEVATLIGEQAIKVGPCPLLREQLLGIFFSGDSVEIDCDRKDMVDGMVGAVITAKNNSLDFPVLEYRESINHIIDLSVLDDYNEL